MALDDPERSRTMGFEYFKRPLRSAADSNSRLGDATVGNSLTVPVEALTGSGALQSLSTSVVAHFITQGTSGSGRDFRLPNPVAGAFHVIAINPNTTSPNDVRIVCQTTAQTFFGTTANEIAVDNSTAAGDVGRRTILLVGVSTSQWAALVSGTTNTFVFNASTGSTGQ